jgi:hypothetical protein
VQPPDFTSQHPVDQLIVRLIFDEVEASPNDVQRIIDRIATAPFSRRSVRVPSRERGMIYGGIVLGRVSESLSYHLVKRVRLECQWTDGTTADEYLHDVQDAVRHPTAQVLVYERSGDFFAATISPTIEVVPVERLGRDWQPNLLVAYSAQHAMVTTSYMFSSLEAVNFPERIRWFR